MAGDGKKKGGGKGGRARKRGGGAGGAGGVGGGGGGGRGGGAAGQAGGRKKRQRGEGQTPREGAAAAGGGGGKGKKNKKKKGQGGGTPAVRPRVPMISACSTCANVLLPPIHHDPSPNPSFTPFLRRRLCGWAIRVCGGGGRGGVFIPKSPTSTPTRACQRTPPPPFPHATRTLPLALPLTPFPITFRITFRAPHATTHRPQCAAFLFPLPFSSSPRFLSSHPLRSSLLILSFLSLSL